MSKNSKVKSYIIKMIIFVLIIVLGPLVIFFSTENLKNKMYIVNESVSPDSKTECVVVIENSKNYKVDDYILFISEATDNLVIMEQIKEVNTDHIIIIIDEDERNEKFKVSNEDVIGIVKKRFSNSSMIFIKNMNVIVSLIYAMAILIIGFFITTDNFKENE
ncbi:MAG: hypothetical protein LBV51_05110 [Acholeplasmatales bacterium]|jgi:hypothetical protein|nr:hypothetical protein [Acholeplasmatales bacterium]